VLQSSAIQTDPTVLLAADALAGPLTVAVPASVPGKHGEGPGCHPGPSGSIPTLMAAPCGPPLNAGVFHRALAYPAEATGFEPAGVEHPGEMTARCPRPLGDASVRYATTPRGWMRVMHHRNPTWFSMLW
jgi:hypothetical protein